MTKKESDLLLYFRKDGCIPCKRMAPIVEEICQDNGVKLIYNDFEGHKDIFKEYGVQGIPTIIRIKDGEEVGRLTGLQPVDKLTHLISSNYDYT